MISLVLILIFLLEYLLLAGLFLINTTTKHDLKRTSDLSLISLWLGFIVTINLLLLPAFLGPLTFYTLLGFLLPVIIFSLTSRATWIEFKIIHWDLFSAKFSFIFLITLLALMASFPSDCGDTGNYHLQAMKWLSEFGVVPGIAHLEHRLGFASSWYTIPAALNHGPMENKVHGVMGSLCYFLFLYQVLNAFINLKKNQAASQDYFSIGSLIFLWPFRYFESASLSPNIGIIFGVQFFCWLALTIYSSNRLSVHLNNSSAFMLIFTAIGLSSIKISAFPLLAITFIWIVFNRCYKVFFSPKLLILNLLCLLPARAASYLFSGFPFYPSGALQVPADWALSEARLAEIRQGLFDYWLCWHFSSCDLPWQITLSAWFDYNSTLIWLFLLTAILSIAAIKQRTFNLRGIHTLLITLAWVGILFSFWNAPGHGFMIAWLFIIPALSIFQANGIFIHIICAALLLLTRLFLTRYSAYAYGLYFALTFFLLFMAKPSQINFKNVIRSNNKLLPALLLFGLTVSLAIDIRIKRHMHEIPGNLIFPSDTFEIKSCEFEIAKRSNFEYWQAFRTSGTKCQCWQHELPCTLEVPEERLQIRDAACGIACGFYIPESEQNKDEKPEV